MRISNSELRAARTLTRLLVASLCIAISSAGFSARKEAPNIDTKKIDDIITSAIQAKVFPGAVVMVGSPDKEYYSKAYGTLTYDADAKPTQMDTLFDLASVTKVVGTATTAMSLIEDGDLKLDTRVSKFIPEFTTGGKEKVTVRDLMTHVSGLPSYVSVTKVEAAKKSDELKSDNLIRVIAGLKATVPPRTKVVYSCLNMLTQARINEIVLGGREDTYVKERVYKPLGMKDTTWLLTDEQKQRTAPTSKKKNGSYNEGETHDPLANYHGSEDHCPGNAGLFSTAPDLARYCKMILNGGALEGKRVFKIPTVREMTKVQTPKGIEDKRGLGWDVYTSGGLSTKFHDTDEHELIGHTGYTGTYLLVDEYTKTYIVLLANRTLPNGADSEDGRIGGVRRAVAETIFKALPQYKTVDFDSEPGKSKRGSRPRS